MKKNLILLCLLFMATALISSCAQDAMEPEVDAAATGAETRAYGDKTPKVMMYIEVNDTNPLNTMLYRMNKVSGGYRGNSARNACSDRKDCKLPHW